ncbi:MAG: bifunctional demethylmenaquinone methyltransferase/2-methoxy-6-polyprenyl-1,4-benzoquinol methylase UbiE [Acidobacteria bacterium]|nr:bifunctional demethylmenaquinone methyltransferase/2-methoxy-6-polyprenyl-1,4-benzoquinol methylase UbiE [Acidobacteriota bacterium]
MEREYLGPDSARVRRMFGAIAHRYDFLNHFLSASIDRYWRRAAVNQVRELTGPAPPGLCLDACSGTGDLALALHRRLGARVIATDFCHPMLTRARTKFAAARTGAAVQNVEADTLSLPFADDSFDALAIAFGLRNLEDVRRGLREMRRVLQPGGALVILEFSKPVVPVFRHVFDFYFSHILPRLGSAISGDASAYRYLPDSVGKFPSRHGLGELMIQAKFRCVEFRNLSGGIAALHWGKK